jgi:Mg2+/citrate symporter
MSDGKPPEASRPVYWPAEWAVERAFWREVAARTLAGVFTLVVVGVPALIYAGASGVLDSDQVWTILIGIVLAAVVVVAYVLVLRGSRRRERSKIDSAERAERIEAARRHIGLTDAQMERVLQDVRREIVKQSNFERILATIGAFIGLVVASLSAGLLR